MTERCHIQKYRILDMPTNYCDILETKCWKKNIKLKLLIPALKKQSIKSHDKVQSYVRQPYSVN
jgi:hypothetical protein